VTTNESSYSPASTGEALDLEGLISLMHLEFDGERLYNTIADRIPHADAAELVRRNGREETMHGERLIEAIALKTGAPYVPEQRGTGKDVELPERISIKFLRRVAQGEHDGGANYQTWAEHEPNEAIARLLRQNGREEVMHARRVEQAAEMIDQLPPPIN